MKQKRKTTKYTFFYPDKCFYIKYKNLYDTPSINVLTENCLLRKINKQSNLILITLHCNYAVTCKTAFKRIFRIHLYSCQKSNLQGKLFRNNKIHDY